MFGKDFGKPVYVEAHDMLEFLDPSNAPSNESRASLARTDSVAD
jgi:hypothetical protein